MSIQPWPRAAAALALLLTVTAHAQSTDKKFWSHVGPVAVLFNSDTQLVVGSAPVPGPTPRRRTTSRSVSSWGMKWRRPSSCR